jgi:hypothetical protein
MERKFKYLNKEHSHIKRVNVKFAKLPVLGAWIFKAVSRSKHKESVHTTLTKVTRYTVPSQLPFSLPRIHTDSEKRATGWHILFIGIVSTIPTPNVRLLKYRALS